MKEYLLIWRIDIEADSPKEAVIQALEIQRDPESAATVFIVKDKETGKEVQIDEDGTEYPMRIE